MSFFKKLTSTFRIVFWFTLLVAASILAIWLRPKVDISSLEPMKVSAASAKILAQERFDFLGIPTDSSQLKLMVDYQQQVTRLSQYGDSLDQKSPNWLQELRQQGIALNTWDAFLVGTGSIAQDVGFSASDLYTSLGAVKIQTDNLGRVLSFEQKDQALNGFLEGSNPEATARNILAEFGYQVASYVLVSDSSNTEWSTKIEGGSVDSVNTDRVNLVFETAQAAPNQPKQVGMVLLPEQIEQEGRNTLGFSLQAFNAYPQQVQSASEVVGSQLDVFILLFNIVLLFFFAVIGAIVPIMKGRVDWKQALIILLLLLSATYVWRAVYTFRLGFGIIEWSQFFILLFNYYFSSGIIALYGVLAYIGWYSLARDQKQPEFRLISEFWYFRFKFKESGLALLRSLSLGVSLVAISFLGLSLVKTFMFNFEGPNFGVSEPESFFPPFTIAISSWSSSWLTATGLIAVVVSLLKKWFKFNLIAALFGILIFSLTGPYFTRMYATNLDIWQDILLWLPFATLCIYIFQRMGLITLSLSIFVYTMIIHSLPFLHLEAAAGPLGYDLLNMLGLFAFFPVGAWLYLKAPSVEDEREILPEYELKYQTQARLVKEIEVARQTQMQLMPSHPPRIEGADVYGFFMPSFEVGGDYYYYFKVNQNNREELAFTLLDVSGKAMRAAIQAVFTSGLLMSRMATDTPDDILDAIAPMVYEHTDARTFITCIVGRYDSASKVVDFANAGHCMPLLKRGHVAEFIETEAPKFPLGMRKEVDYKAKKVQLQPGDVFLLYSDGFPEAEDRNRNRIGFQGIRAILSDMETDTLSAREIAETIKSRIINHSGNRLADDTTLIVMKIEA